MIIDNSRKRSAWSRRRDWLLSAAMWLLYLFLIRQALVDLYELARDLLQWRFWGADRPSLPAISRFLDILKDYGLVILANGAILILWALYNQVRFGGPELRVARPPVGVADLAELYGLPAEDIAVWQRSRILTMDHGPDGALVKVTAKKPRPAASLAAEETGSA